jgi:hypothetical protein
MAGPRKRPTRPKPAAPAHPPPRPYHPPPARGTVGPLVFIALKTAVAVCIIAGVVKIVARLGDTAAEQVAPNDRYTVPFARIEVEPPRGLDKTTFLSEARHLGDGPLTVQAVDPELPAKLTAVFAKHPWVESVEGVNVTPDGTVWVGLKYRGVLLPLLPPPPADLPKLVTPRPAPPAPAGQPWADDTVRRAADLAATYRPATIEKTPRGWLLLQPDGRKQVVAY